MLSRRRNLQQKMYRFRDTAYYFQIDRQPSSLSRAIVIANLRAWGGDRFIACDENDIAGARDSEGENFIGVFLFL